MHTAVPERTVYFKGSTGPATNKPIFDMDPKITYPMDGGTALVTFEEAAGELIHKLQPKCFGFL